MNQALAKFLHEVEMPDGGIAEEAFLRGWRAALEASHHAKLVAGARVVCARVREFESVLTGVEAARYYYSHVLSAVGCLESILVDIGGGR